MRSLTVEYMLIFFSDTLSVYVLSLLVGDASYITGQHFLVWKWHTCVCSSCLLFVFYFSPTLQLIFIADNTYVMPLLEYHLILVCDCAWCGLLWSQHSSVPEDFLLSFVAYSLDFRIENFELFHFTNSLFVSSYFLNGFWYNFPLPHFMYGFMLNFLLFQAESAIMALNCSGAILGSLPIRLLSDSSRLPADTWTLFYWHFH